MHNDCQSPGGGGILHLARDTGNLNQFASNGCPGDSPGGSPDDEDDNYPNDRQPRDNYKREFILVISKNIVIPNFSGTNSTMRPYMPFNTAIRKLIKAQGPRGTVLFIILDEVENYGAEPFDHDKLEALIAQCPRAQ